MTPCNSLKVSLIQSVITQKREIFTAINLCFTFWVLKIYYHTTYQKTRLNDFNVASTSDVHTALLIVRNKKSIGWVSLIGIHIYFHKNSRTGSNKTTDTLLLWYCKLSLCVSIHKIGEMQSLLE
jgi:hypothetical protein